LVRRERGKKGGAALGDLWIFDLHFPFFDLDNSLLLLGLHLVLIVCMVYRRIGRFFGLLKKMERFL
jgi:hypothetical protein